MSNSRQVSAAGPPHENVRLTNLEQQAIRAAVAARFGESARVMLFGSRADGQRRGGDIDLLVEVPDSTPHGLRETLALEVDLIRAIGDRRIDILVTAPTDAEQPIHRIARATGIWL